MDCILTNSKQKQIVSKCLAQLIWILDLKHTFLSIILFASTPTFKYSTYHHFMFSYMKKSL